jgi:hypothetical protein
MINIINCIEKKPTHRFEAEAKLYLNSFSTLSPDLFNNVKINILQPTPNDISNDTLNVFDKFKVEFTKVPSLSQKQINTDVNYTNKCVTCDYFSNILHEDYMCWLDLDIIFLQEAGADFFKPTDKIIITVYDVDNEFSTKDKLFKVDYFYETYFKKHLSNEFYVQKIRKYLCGWFTYGPTKHPYWSAWKKLTYNLIDIVHTHYPEEIPGHLESTCEEIATSLIHELHPEWFIDVRDFFLTNTLAFRECLIDNEPTMQCAANTVIYHYNELQGFKSNGFPNQHYVKPVFKLMLQTFKEVELQENWGCSFKDLFLQGALNVSHA